MKRTSFPGTGTPSQIIPFSLPAGVVANKVKVQLNGTNYLSLAEVEVFGCAVTGSGTDITYALTEATAIYATEYYPEGHPNQFLKHFDIDPLGLRTEYLYDANNRVTQINTPDDAGTGTIAKSRFTWDSAGRLATSSDALGRTLSLDYDSRDRLVKTLLLTTRLSPA